MEFSLLNDLEVADSIRSDGDHRRVMRGIQP